MNLCTFDFEQNAVRAFTDDQGNSWFVGVDITNALGLENNRRVVSRLEDDEKDVHIVDTPGGRQQVVVINESGLYSLILTSRKPEAKRFKKWVTAVVLPSIRKTGSYRMPEATEVNSGQGTPEDWMSFATGRPMPMLDAVTSILAVGQAMGKTGIKKYEALDASIQTIERHVGLPMQHMRATLKEGSNHLAQLRFRNEQARQIRRLSADDLDAPWDKEVFLAPASVPKEVLDVWRQWAMLPMQQRCLQVLWAHDLRARAVVVWYMMEHHRRVGCLGSDQALEVCAQDVWEVAGELLGASRSNINVAINELLERKTLGAKPHVTRVVRSLWLDPQWASEAMRTRFPNEEVMLLNAIFGSRTKAILIQHLIDQSNQISQSHDAPITLSTQSLVAQFANIWPQIKERNLLNAVRRLEQAGLIKVLSGTGKTQSKRIILQREVVQRAMDAFYDGFTTQVATPKEAHGQAV